MILGSETSVFSLSNVTSEATALKNVLLPVNQQLFVHFTESDFLIQGDRTRLIAIIRYLIEFTLKYIERGSVILSADYQTDQQVTDGSVTLSFSIQGNNFSLSKDEKRAVLEQLSSSTR